MRRPLLACSVAATLFCASAFATDAHPPRRAVLVETPSNCPVELSAEQAHDAAAIDVDKGERSGRQQVIDLSIKNTRLARIVGAEVEVHGTSPRSRALAVQSAQMDRAVSDAVRTVRLNASVPANQTTTHRVNAEELTSVQWLNVIELRYADGSVWHATPDRVCRVEPNPWLRVASDRDLR